MTAALETVGLGKRYGLRRWALHDLDLAVEEGTITALVGPNGSGKSTLLKAWVGFERPTTGRLRIHGVDPVRHRGQAIRLAGFVPQQPSLYRELSVGDHLAFATAHRPGFDAALARRYLDDLSIPLDSRADQLSGGQQAQVGLALALGSRAPVLLLDEPLASLDPLARREFLGVLVTAVRESGATALLSSHVITDIEQACDHLIVLGGGRALLAVSIAEAIAGHTVVDLEPVAPRPLGSDVVGSFPGPDGERLTLVRGGGGRAATLEEVVIGHLAAGRPKPLTSIVRKEAA
ncbi:MAG TPA: ABC transporter ATP-binding protein [Candidatus Limnocylindrales bacterium]|nr:ABC transporter ATP-binding protein [Candidatus Limnocylindrales bacterium]